MLDRLFCFVRKKARRYWPMSKEKNNTLDDSGRPSNVRVLAKPHFEVEWGSQILCFDDISGLEGGEGPVMSTPGVPGESRRGYVMMKKGRFASDIRFWDWYCQTKREMAERGPVTVRLVEESGITIMVWTLTRVWPLTIKGPNLESDSAEVAIDMLEVVHEGLTPGSVDVAGAGSMTG